MKKVFRNHAEVCHVWAQQNQSEGRSGNIFFDGPSIYSYGRHFEMARFVKPDIVLFNSQKYSISTAGHQWIIRRAISHKTVFTVPSLDGDHELNLKYYMDKASALPIRISRSRIHGDYLINELKKTLNEAKSYIDFFDVPKALYKKAYQLFDKLSSGDYQDLIAQQKEAKKKALEVWRKKREQEAEKNKESLEQWKQGSLHAYGNFYYLPCALRVKGDEIETSRGARIPLSVGLAMYKALKNGISVHGMALGSYTVTSFDGQTLKVGCHEIPLAEMERLYQTLEVK